MPDIGQPERATQQRVIKLFREELGYRFLGDWSDRPNNSNVEGSLLTAFLSKNGNSPAQISRALDRLRTEAGNPNRSLYDNNKAVYSLLRYGVQVKVQSQARETPRDYTDRESHYLWGRRYLLKILEKEAVPTVDIEHSQIWLQVRPGSDEATKQTVLNDWYRAQVRQALEPLIAKWERLMGVRVNGFLVRRMKTKWGSCSPRLATIRLNLELAKKPPECLEYILVHEMAHLLEPTHNKRFTAQMDRFMPKWRFYRDELNRLSVCHQEWDY